MHENPSAGKFERPPDLAARFEPPADAEAARTRRRRGWLLFALAILLSVPIPERLVSGRAWLTVLSIVLLIALNVLNFMVERKHDEESGWEPYTRHPNITR